MLVRPLVWLGGKHSVWEIWKPWKHMYQSAQLGKLKQSTCMHVVVCVCNSQSSRYLYESISYAHPPTTHFTTITSTRWMK